MLLSFTNCDEKVQFQWHARLLIQRSLLKREALKVTITVQFKISNTYMIHLATI